MQEVTRIITVEITGIAKCEEYMSKEDAKKHVTDRIKECLGADDVVVTNVQDFVREVQS